VSLTSLGEPFLLAAGANKAHPSTWERMDVATRAASAEDSRTGARLQMRAAAPSGSRDVSVRFHKKDSRMLCEPSVTSMLIGTVFSGRACLP